MGDPQRSVVPAVRRELQGPRRARAWLPLRLAISQCGRLPSAPAGWGLHRAAGFAGVRAVRSRLWLVRPDGVPRSGIKIWQTACLGCIVGCSGAANVSAILILAHDTWIANRAGCIALIDGDNGATGYAGRGGEAAEMCMYTTPVSLCARPTRLLRHARTPRRMAPAVPTLAKRPVRNCRAASAAVLDFTEYYSAMADLASACRACPRRAMKRALDRDSAH